MVVDFAERLGFEMIAVMLLWMNGRISAGCRGDVADLCKIPGVGVKRARNLFACGLRTLGDVAAADPAEVSAALRGRFAREAAAQIIWEARRIAGVELAAGSRSAAWGS